MHRPWNRGGTWLVVAMFAFGAALTAGLYAYWTLHAAPFRPVADDLAKRYPGSAPRVDGGRERADRDGEMLLRVVMRSPFDPADEARATSFAREVMGYLAETRRLDGFDAVEVRLFRERPEREPSQRTVRMKVEEPTRVGSGPWPSGDGPAARPAPAVP